jgi:hypothetical protein
MKKNIYRRQSQQMNKKLGIPKEVKQDEGRMALIPEHITQ